MNSPDTRKSPDRRPPVTGMKTQLTRSIPSSSGISEPTSPAKENQAMDATPNPRQAVDIDTIRSYPTVGPETVAALCDEVEQLREQHAKFRALYDRNVGSLVDELDTATADIDRLKAENTLLGEALDEAVSDNAILVNAVRCKREVIEVTAELERVCRRYGIDAMPEPDPESRDRVAIRDTAADVAIEGDEAIQAAYALIQERTLMHIHASYEINVGAR